MVVKNQCFGCPYKVADIFGDTGHGFICTRLDKDIQQGGYIDYLVRKRCMDLGPDLNMLLYVPNYWSES